jgi:hypothetical protein
MDSTKTPPRCKARGAVHFPPFENLDEASLREVRKFQVHPLGSIRETCERIPYNSGKKDFFSKTGREGFEGKDAAPGWGAGLTKAAFHYEFRVPGDDTSYTVMWDYNVGLVRMTSFFKCRGYSKVSAVLVLLQALLTSVDHACKDAQLEPRPQGHHLQHHGWFHQGSRCVFCLAFPSSQSCADIPPPGYWMPYICAKAICATFCHSIAGALIPLFGPQFPFDCIPEKAPGYGRMIINPELVARATTDAAALFRPPPGRPSPLASRSASPLPSQRSVRVHGVYDYQSDHGHDRRLLLSPYTDTDVDYHPGPEPYGHRMYPAIPPMRIPTSRPPFGPAPVPTPLHSPSWTAVNHPQLPAAAYHHRTVSHLNEELNGLNVSATANPYLSAVPRSPTPAAGGAKWHPYYPRSHHHDHQYQHTSSPVSTSLPERGITLPPLRLKRRFDQVDGTPNRKNNDVVDDDDKAYDAEEEEEAENTHPSTASTASPTSSSPSPSTPSSSSNQHIVRATAAAAQQAGWSKPATSITTPTVAPHEHEHIPRRASERDAAIMLLHMRGPGPVQGRGNAPLSSSSESSSSGPPSPSEEELEEDDGDDEDGGNAGGGGGRKGVDGRRSERRKGKDGNRREKWGGEDGGGGGGGGGGPNTRAKRRRTVER